MKNFCTFFLLSSCRLLPAYQHAPCPALLPGLYAADPRGRPARWPGGCRARQHGNLWECQPGYVCHHRQVIFYTIYTIPLLSWLIQTRLFFFAVDHESKSINACYNLTWGATCFLGMRRTVYSKRQHGSHQLHHRVDREALSLSERWVWRPNRRLTQRKWKGKCHTLLFMLPGDFIDTFRPLRSHTGTQREAGISGSHKALV